MQPFTLEEGCVIDCNLKEYRILDKIGQGSFGAVYKAVQIVTERLVAIKMLRYQEPVSLRVKEQRVARFESELQICSFIDHPHIVTLLNKGYTVNGELFGIFEYVAGTSLRDIMDNGGCSVVEAGAIMGQVLHALSYLHARNIVHRDLKPQNIIVARNGLQFHPVIIDFGISTLMSGIGTLCSGRLLFPGRNVGTPAYSAPEQLQGEQITVKSDIYSWGLILMECLTGHRAIHNILQSGILPQQLDAPSVHMPPEISGHPVSHLLEKVLHNDVRYRLGDANAIMQEYEKINFSDLSGKVIFHKQQTGSSDEDATVIMEH